MNIEKVKRVELILLDVQVDIILKALAMYIEEINKKYNYRKVCLTKEENIERSIVKDTYSQIHNSKNNELRCKKSTWNKLRRIS